MQIHQRESENLLKDRNVERDRFPTVPGKRAVNKYFFPVTYRRICFLYIFYAARCISSFHGVLPESIKTGKKKRVPTQHTLVNRLLTR